ncbi:bacteriocin ABC transporter ATP-binding protein [Amycolatopsis orientalis]|uniref:Bacteriocin ABC transporter ATP-binding protein n=1 Tax=Amycolatopsis orientalis TaxID=31958 RepID=A0A193C0E8_AMYOR|nr:ABC transporter ATP-binding protein [Amycolatopsis orientalis]ANN17986.1 bacteriocin ABC transporter ATP-binding protein [Amycolatopsis orientalis]
MSVDAPEHAALAVTGLVKRYRRSDPAPAVDGLDFRVPPGEVFGLLGPNGAGKTTTIGVLTTRIRPTAGTVLLHGVDVVRSPSSACRLFAAVSQRNTLDRSLTVRQNLLFHARYHRVPRAERNRRAVELLDVMGLTGVAGKRLDHLSGGQAQRIMIARALMHHPRVLFLDEPSTGLDPQARLFVHERIRELRARGTTVLLTTHDMDEAAKLCDRIGIVDHGRMLTIDTPEELTRSLPVSRTLDLAVRFGGDTGPVVAALAALPGVREVELAERKAGLVRLRVSADREPGELLPPALDVIARAGGAVQEFGIGKVSLEDVFIRMTGRDLR